MKFEQYTMFGSTSYADIPSAFPMYKFVTSTYSAATDELRNLRKRVKAQRKQLRDLQKCYDLVRWRIEMDLKG